MYWLEHKHGADFITLDAGTDNKDGGSMGAYTGAQKFADVAAWLRKLPRDRYPGARTLPLWWAEWKAETSPASRATSATSRRSWHPGSRRHCEAARRWP